MDYIAQPKDYWIAPNAIHISLNALGDANRIQCSVATGSVIMCYIYGTTNDGLGYDNGHQYRTWPIVIAPTYFNTNTQKYVYAAIPKNQSVGTTAMVVFPTEQLDIYGKNESNEQVGSTDYYFIWLQGIISEVWETNSTLERQWTQNINYGLLNTDQARDAKIDDTSWYSYSNLTEIVTFLKEIVMNVGSSFRNLFLGPDGGKELTSVATDSTTPTDSTTAVVTPAYASNKYLSRQHPDTAAGKITFQQGFQSDKNGEFGEFEEGASGASVYKDDDDNWHVEADFLHARRKLTAKELQIEEVKHVGGQMMLTAAECITDFVIEYDDYYRCFFLMKDDDGKTIYNKWRIGDQAFMQSFNVEKWSNDDDSSADADGLRNRYYWRLVVGSDIESNLSDYNEDFSSDYGFDRNGNLPNGRNLGEYHWIDLSKTQCALLSDAPLAEDKIVQLGNQNGEQDRENAIVIVGAGTSSPYIDEYVGIVSFHLPEPETRLKPGQNVLSGLVNMKSNSTYAGRELSSYFSSIGDMESSISEMDNDINNITRSIEEITSGLDQLSSGNENLLRNTGFTGDYMTMDVSDSEDVDGGTKTYSDPLQHWEHDGANVVPNIVSASGFSVRLNSGRIYQQATKPINGGSMYCLSFRAKGTTLQYSFGGVIKTITLESSVKRYTNRIQITNPSDNVFKIFETNAEVMEIMLTEGSIPNTDWIPSPLDNDKTLAFYQNLTYLANAITNASTSILGGLILTQMIRVGNYRDGAMVAETGGMSGLFTSGNSPFLWGGGTMEDAFYTINKYIEDPSYQATDEEVEQMAKFVVTHGGRAILNDIILRGYIYAKGGVFNGTVYAQDGVFNGTVNATSGVFRNIASPQDRFKIDENGYLECVDARVKGSIYNPLLIINDGNMTGKVTPHWTDPPNPVIDYYVINLAVTGLNIQVDWTWPNNAYIQLPCTDSSYNGAKAHIYNSTASDVIVHGSMTNIGNNYTLTSGKLGIFYCIYVSAGRYVWTQIATS